MRERLERESLERSEEEEDMLARSTKKFKDSHNADRARENVKGSNVESYKDKLVGAIPGAFAQAFGFESSMQEDVESDIEEDCSHDGNIRVRFSKEEKMCMRAPWQKALIIKTFGKRMAFSFLVERVRKMWSPCGGMDCIDLGYDYYLVKFELAEDVDSILKGGPWFIGHQFLAIRQWEPEFKASTATLSSVAVWIRLPELPMEFYEPSALKKIGRAIGPVLRIDSHTASWERGRFARLCVQVNLDKPLVRKIFIGKLEQCVLYEGINALCFSCGRIGHKLEACPYIVREQNKDQSKDQHEVHNESSDTQEEGGLKDKGKEKSQEDYGEWMVVTRKKVSNKAKPMLKPLAMDNLVDVQQTQMSAASVTKSKGTSQTDRSGKRKSLHTQHTVALKETNVMAKSSQNLSKIGKSSKGKGARANSLRKGEKPAGEQSKLVGQSKCDKVFAYGPLSEPSPFVFTSPSNTSFNPLVNEEFSASSTTERRDGKQGEMGDLLQRKNHSSGGGDNPLDKARPNRNLGLVRARSANGVEEPFSTDGAKQAAGLLADERRGLDHDAEPVVEVFDGSSSGAGSSGDKLKIISHRIKHAELRKISIGGGSGADGASCHRKEDIAHQSGGMLVDGQPPRGENDHPCQSCDVGHGTNQDCPGRMGDHKALGDSVPRGLGVEEGANGAMEVEDH